MSEHPEPRSLEELLGTLRSEGWVVAVHNDYHLGGVLHTFWLFTRRGWSVKGEGKSDREALEQVLAQVKDFERDSQSLCYGDDGEGLTRRLYDAFLSTFREAADKMPSLSHFADHVQNRWSYNLRVALRRGTNFIHSGK